MQIENRLKKEDEQTIELATVRRIALRKCTTIIYNALVFVLFRKRFRLHVREQSLL